MHLLGAIENKTNRSNVDGLTGVDRHPMNNSGENIVANARDFTEKYFKREEILKTMYMLLRDHL